MQLNPKPQPPGSPTGTYALLLALVVSGMLTGCLGGISGDLDGQAEPPGEPIPCATTRCARELIVDVCQRRGTATCAAHDYEGCLEQLDQQYADSARSSACEAAHRQLLRCQAAATWECDFEGELHAPTCAQLEAQRFAACPCVSDASADAPVGSNAVP